MSEMLETRTRLRRILPIAAAILFLAGGWVIYRELRSFRYHDLIAALREIPRDRIALALGITIINYLVLSGYDALALRYSGRKLPWRRVGIASFIGYALNNTLGFSGVFGGSVRYRLYTAWGVSAVDVAKVIAFGTITFWLGFTSVAGAWFAFDPIIVAPEVALPIHSTRLLGIVMLLAVAAYLVASIRYRKPLTIRGHEITLPTPRIALAQIVLSSIDWLLAIAVLRTLLPDTVRYGDLASAFLFAQVAGVASGLPGGIGVFESVLILLLRDAIGGPALLARLLAFRAVYYLFPLAVACVVLAAYELWERRRVLRRAAAGLAALSMLTPYGLAGATFVAGVVLLFSGATPPLHGRFVLIQRVLSLPAVEFSHLIASVTGAMLLLLARGLQRRLNGAYYLTIALLGLGSLLSLLKGFDYEEASILTLVLIVLIPARRHFYRRTTLIDEPFSSGWITAIALVLAASIWLGFFSFKHVQYSHDLWWHFSMTGNAPRFLRASIAATTILLVFAFRKLFHSPLPPVELPGEDDLRDAQKVALTSCSAEAFLALTGDKHLLFNGRRSAYVMYGISGRSWVAMGDPTGHDDEIGEVAWLFREECDRHNAWPVFYEVSSRLLPLYIDLSLMLLKIGEAARVPLGGFGLEGRTMKSLRKTYNQVREEGCGLEVVAPKDVPPLLPALRTISDSWLAHKNTREKRFSLGWFDEAYLARTPIAVVRRGEEIVAFANLWQPDRKDEVSLDLMRYRDDAPSGVMDYLFAELMLWARDAGYAWFNLGMAPLSGVEARSLGPLWNRAAALAFHHAEHFYNFQGLRQYKEKFRPVWEPRYLAVPRGLALPRILTNVAALISGSIRGVITK